MNVKANVKLVIIFALIAAAVCFVAFPHPRLLPDGSTANVSLVQMYGMQIADGRIQSIVDGEKEEMATPIQTASGGRRSGTKMKAIGARLSADAQQIKTLQPIGYPHKANEYKWYAAAMAAKAQAFQTSSENCE